MTKQCVICGVEFTPKRKDQVTCLDADCRHKQHLNYMARYAKQCRSIKGVDIQTYKREKAREYRAKARGEEYVPNLMPEKLKETPKSDASTYAERQMKKTLAMVGKVQI